MRARPLPSTRPRPAPFGNTAEALHAVRTLIEATADADTPISLPDRLVAEARHFFRMSAAVLLRVTGSPPRAQVSAMDPEGVDEPGRLIPLDGSSPIAQLPGSDVSLCVAGTDAADVCDALGLPGDGTVLLLPIRVSQALNVLVLVSARPREFCEEQLDIAAAFAAAVGAGLARFLTARDNATRTERQVELSRAAQSLNASLDLNRVLVRVCEESARILEADTAVVYLNDDIDGLRIEAGTGVGAEAIGVRLQPGEGLAGRVFQAGEPALTNDYRSLTGAPAIYSDVQSAMAVPLRWGDELRGVLSLGWKRRQQLREENLTLLNAFGEIAASACRNASTHEGVMTAARTDALTGCLNQAALHDTLRRELERSGRTGGKLSLAIVDLDDFKQVNERHGHLAGDEVLRRVGRALRRTVRPYDVVGRYGGDEFAILAVDTEEAAAADVAARAIARVGRSLEELEYADLGTGATAGVAEWRRDETHTQLIARADRALLYGKHEGARGTAIRVSEVPGDFRPSGSGRALRLHSPPVQDALSESR